MEISDSDSDEEDLSPEEMPLEIRLLLDCELYFVGQEICGIVEIINEYKRRMRGIRLSLRCRAEVVWWEQKGGKSETKNVNDDDLLYSEKYIVGAGKTMWLDPGKHEFPFSISLKSKKKSIRLPSSMELPKGHIRYFIKAELDWPWASALEHERLVSVLDICNLRDVRESLQPATFTKTFTVGMSRKKIHVAGILEKLGYAPGEEILLHIEIDNESNTRISNWMAQIVEVVRYVASNGKHVTSRHVLVSNEYGHISRKSNMVMTKEPLMVPAVPQSFEASVDFMKVSYEVCIVICLGSSQKSVSNRILIGTCPTKRAYTRFHTGTLPPEVVCVWPFKHIEKLPCPQICDHAPNSETNWDGVMKIDPDFKLLNVCYGFNREKAVDTFDDESDSESDEDGEELEHQMSEFSM